jgi:hypothetical protein
MNRIETFDVVFRIDSFPANLTKRTDIPLDGGRLCAARCEEPNWLQSLGVNVPSAELVVDEDLIFPEGGLKKAGPP